MRFSEGIPGNVNSERSLFFALQREKAPMDLSDLQCVHYMVSKLAVISMNTSRKRKSIAKHGLHLMKLLDSVSGGCLFVK